MVSTQLEFESVCCRRESGTTTTTPSHYPNKKIMLKNNQNFVYIQNIQAYFVKTFLHDGLSKYLSGYTQYADKFSVIYHAIFQESLPLGDNG